MSERKRIYVLDTNVLMHDPTALFRFEEHDVFIPMTVLEELDNGKKGTSEVARNARQVSRFINELIEAHGAERIERGLKLVRPKGLNLRRESQIGRLLFQTSAGDPAKSRMKVMPDNQILAAIVALHQQHPQTDVVLVSKDINLRIKASIFGVPAEDYENDRALDDFSLLYTGHTELPADFWSKHAKDLRSWSEKGHTFYELKMRKNEDWSPHQCLYLAGEDEPEFRVLSIRDNIAKLQILDDFTGGSHSVWGIHARNREQNFALNALMDPDVDFVTLLGTAGTGKTLLALAAGL
ncbi:MAG: PhoH family protein, partial [Xanthomonadales bacterium]|nr:PhoH family protein [Xanthomonadales bacterium]